MTALKPGDLTGNFWDIGQTGHAGMGSLSSMVAVDFRCGDSKMTCAREREDRALCSRQPQLPTEPVLCL